MTINWASEVGHLTALRPRSAGLVEIKAALSRCDCSTDDGAALPATTGGRTNKDDSWRLPSPAAEMKSARGDRVYSEPHSRPEGREREATVFRCRHPSRRAARSSPRPVAALPVVPKKNATGWRKAPPSKDGPDTHTPPHL